MDGKIVRARREQAVAKLDDALALDPKNSGLASAREEQLKKLSALLTERRSNRLPQPWPSQS